ncbi:M36 family metallopeptidase [Actinopolymorpha alba]|uniref:M36 family metallopeptidase n=1 Tax=Actinopolymorpha alba TaxID=533267 RepID=UPI00035EAF10|nr:M36 family metallopeptidase [Actinopolymorpha alba]
MRTPRSWVTRIARQAATAVGVPMLALTGSLTLPATSAVAEGEEGSSQASRTDVLSRPAINKDIDVREGRVAPSAQQLRRIRALGATARWTRFGTAASVLPADGTLASDLRGTPAAVARRFVEDNRVLFHMTAARVRGLELLSVGALAAAGAGDGGRRAHVVVFRERFGDLPAGAGGLITVGVADDAVVYVSSSAYGDAPAPEPPRLSAVQAWLRAATAVGQPVSPNAVGPIDQAANLRDWTTFTVAGMAQSQQARLVAVGIPGRGVRPAYETNVVDVQDGTAAASTSFVDAGTGAVLIRHDRVDHLLDPSLLDPSLLDPDASGCVPGCGILLRTTTTSGPVWAFIYRPSEPYGEDAGAYGSTLTLTEQAGAHLTVNSKAITSPAWTSPLAVGAGASSAAEPMPVGGEFGNAWRRSRCDAANLRPGGNDAAIAAAHVFDLHNQLHDWTYRLGFTEANHNLQQDAGHGGLGGDRQIGYVQAGALTGGYPTYLGRNNANQVTLQDGLPAIASHYLFQPLAAGWYGPCVDSAFDATVVAHEYAHAVTNRMVGGPDTGIIGTQGHPVGEAWSDLLAAEFLLEYGGSSLDGSPPTAIGAYVAGNPRHGVRNYRLGSSPLNVTNAGFDPGNRAADGEIWSAINWDIRQALVRKYDGEAPASDKVAQQLCAGGDRPVARCPGNRRWIQLLFDSLLLQQSSVTMVDARDALLAADRMRFDGANASELWAAFARRGLGPDAKPPAGRRPGVPDFTAPADLTPRIRSGRLIVDARDRHTGTPINVTVYLGRYAAPSTPVVDTDPGSPLARDLALVAGTYDLTWSAPGFGMGRTTTTIKAGRTRYLTLHLSRNLASASNGATVVTSPGGTRPAALIDDNEASSWTVSRSTPDVRGSAIAVDLAGSAPRTVRSVKVSARTADRFAALRRFAIETCVRAPSNPCAVDAPGQWQRIYTSPGDAFPAGRPRPITPDLTFRAFDVPDTPATDVRLVILDTQCTGNSTYHGEQESDPLSTSNCLASGKVDDAALAEFMVYGSDPAPARSPLPYAVWD